MIKGHSNIKILIETRAFLGALWVQLSNLPGMRLYTDSRILMSHNNTKLRYSKRAGYLVLLALALDHIELVAILLLDLHMDNNKDNKVLLVQHLLTHLLLNRYQAPNLCRHDFHHDVHYDYHHETHHQHF